MSAEKNIDLQVMMEMNVGQPIEYFRTTPIELGTGMPRAFLSFYSANYDIDASYQMFCYPKDTLKMIVYTENGDVLWKRDLGPGVVPGHPYCNFFAFDLDGDGVDEIWFVNNRDPLHPFNLFEYCLERVDSETGETIGQWPWPHNDTHQPMSHVFRNHIFGGYVRGEPVLITAQGTYGPTFFQAWQSDMSLRWERNINPGHDGPAGSHVFPVFDINKDGVDEFMWGERCIEMDTGSTLFTADGETWRGHSDMVQPVYDSANERWLIYTNRENKSVQGPRVNLYDDRGERVWGAIEQGHIHKGWIGRIGANGELIATAGKIGGQTKTLAGRFYTGVETFTFDALTGQPYPLPYDTFDTAPIDFNGDGMHEIVCGVTGGDARVIDRFGNPVHTIGGRVALCSKLIDHPGEQVLTYYRDGKVRIWADANAEDCEASKNRYRHPFYRANRKFPTKEYVVCMLGGI